MSPLNVLARGVKADGTTDDVDSLNVAIAEVSSAGGGAIYCPAGTYLLGSVDTGDIKQAGSAGSIIQLKPNVSIYGDGPATIFKIASSLGDFEGIFHQDNPTTAELNNVVFRDFSIDYNAAENAVSDGFELNYNARSGFMLLNGANITISNVRFIDPDATWAIQANGNLYGAAYNIDGLTIENCRFENTGNTTDTYDHSTIYTSGCDHVRIVNNYFYANALGDIGCSAAVETHSSHTFVGGNTIKYYQTGMNITGVCADADNRNIVVDGNTISGAAAGIRLFSQYSGTHTTGDGLSGVVVSNNSISISQQARATAGEARDTEGICLIGYPTSQAPARNISITGNTIDFELESSEIQQRTVASGIIFYTSTVNSMDVYGLNISGNVIEYSPSSGIWLECQLYGATITGNTLVNPGQGQYASLPVRNRSGIYLNVEDARDILISGNSIMDNIATSRIRYGIYTAAINAPSGIVIANNEIARKTGSFVQNTTTAAIATIAPATARIIHAGAGTPILTTRANIGSLWTRTDGGAGYTTYYKESAADSTGWARRQYFSGAYADSIYERTATAGVRIDGTQIKDSIFRGTSARLDTLAMKTALHGIVIDPIVPINSVARAADDTMLAAENVIFFTGQSANVFATLPTYASVPVGKTYLVINCDATATDSVFVEANGAEFLNGLATRRAVGLRGYDAASGYFRAKIMYVNSAVGWARVD